MNVPSAYSFRIHKTLCLLCALFVAKAFDEVVHKRLVTHPRRHQWGPPLPRSEWAKAEQLWRNVIIRPKALRKIRADHSFYARDYISPEYWVDKDHMIRLYPDRQVPDEEWLERKRARG